MVGSGKGGAPKEAAKLEVLNHFRRGQLAGRHGGGDASCRGTGAWTRRAGIRCTCDIVGPFGSCN